MPSAPVSKVPSWTAVAELHSALCEPSLVLLDPAAPPPPLSLQSLEPRMADQQIRDLLARKTSATEIAKALQGIERLELRRAQTFPESWPTQFLHYRQSNHRPRSCGDCRGSKLNSSLLELDLSRTSLVAGLFIDIEFHLPGNSISDDGARALAKALKENSSLKHLNVGCAFMFARFLSLPYDANLAFASCRQRTSGKGSSSNRKGSESKLISHAAQY